jgi:hypothetical protein
MKSLKLFLLFTITLFAIQSNQGCAAQNKFLKGYFIDNSDKKTECLIKTNDKKGYSKSIQYKLSENTNLQSADIESIKEYGFDNYSRYVRFTVKTEYLNGKDVKSAKKDIEWFQDIVFLKELVKGKASLWKSELNIKDLFFYSIDNGQPQLLIHKVYILDNATSENNAFREQILNNIKNENTKYEIVQLLNYDEISLIKYFSVYNKNTDFIVRVDPPKPKREILNFKISGSLSYNKFSITNPSYYPPVLYFDDKVNWMAGAEVEYFFPFYWNAWSLVLAPTFENTYYNKVINNDTKTIDIKNITFPIGLRYTQQISKDTRCFINVFYNSPVNLPFSNSFYFMEYTSPLYTNELANLIVGIGFGIKDLGVEFKYHTNRTLFRSTITENPKVSLTLSYKIFKLSGK